MSLTATESELAESLKESLVWLVVACIPGDNCRAARSAMKHLRKYIGVLERAGFDSGLRLEGLDEIEADIAKAEEESNAKV